MYIYMPDAILFPIESGERRRKIKANQSRRRARPPVGRPFISQRADPIFISARRQVEAVALNPVDYKMAQGGFFIKAFPVVLGCDVAGTVKAVGKAVKGLAVGDDVMSFTPLGTPGYGGFAQCCLAPADQVYKKPTEMSFAEAAALPVAVGTALLGLCWELKLAASPLDKVSIAACKTAFVCRVYERCKGVLLGKTLV